jgi:EmrB/QacA subfamily drug resistance transporter
MTRSVATLPARDTTGPVEQPRTPATPHSAITERWGLPLGVVVIGMFMSVLNTTSVNVALPAMAGDLGAATDDIEWVVTAYNLTLGVVVPASAWLGDRLGLKRLYLISVLAFVVGSALCGVAGDLTTMILCRILQAIPGGMIPVTCMTFLYRIVPPGKIGTAMGMYGLGMVVAPAIGPTLGGYLVEYVDWRLVYYVNVPIGAVGVVAAVAVLPAIPAAPGRRFDGIGFGCVACGLFALLLAASQGQDWGWTGYRVLMLLTASALLIALFVVVELAVDEPLLDVRVFRSWPFVNSLILICLQAIGLFVVSFYVPVFLQEVQGLTPLHTGFLLLPQALVMMALMPVAGRGYDRFGARWPGVLGMGLAGIGVIMLARLNPDLTRWELVAALMLRASGPGLAMMPITTSGISALPARLTGAGSAYNQLVQRGSAALSVAVLTGVSNGRQAQLFADRAALLPGADPRLTAMAQDGPADLLRFYQRLELEVRSQSYGEVFLIAGGISLFGVLLALALPSRGRKF